MSSELKLKLKAAKEIVEELEAKVREAQKEERKAQNLIIAESLSIGTWDCDESPVEVCVYANSYDFCIYCGEPDERK